jgi:hypothetical protein
MPIVVSGIRTPYRWRLEQTGDVMRSARLATVHVADTATPDAEVVLTIGGNLIRFITGGRGRGPSSLVPGDVVHRPDVFRTTIAP